MSAPNEPTLSVANTGTGTSVVATVAGDALVTHRLFYRKSGDSAWTAGLTRTGNGTITQTGLTPGIRYTFTDVADNGVYSLPSAPVTLAVNVTETPIAEQLRQAVETKLLELVPGSASAVSVLKKLGPSTDWSDKQLILMAKPPREVGAMMESQSAKRYQWQGYAVACIRMPDDTEPKSNDQVVEELKADVRKKLTEDYTFGGLALNSKFVNDEEFEHGVGMSGIFVHMDALVCTLYANPNTQG